MRLIKRYLSHISPADKCLLVIFMICLFQTLLMTFFNIGNNQYTNSIDTIVRTTSAGIFGYLLSTNFHAKTMEHSHEVDNPKNFTQTNAVTQKSSTQKSNITMKSTIGFQVSPTNTDNLKKGSLDTKSEHVQSCSRHVQTMIATIIGISSLCILLFLRDFVSITPEMSSTISQLRDFVSGCVGFLLGTRVNNNTNSQNPL